MQEDFKLNSYLNLVPTCFVCNSKKSDKKFEKQHILFYINIAKKTIPKIIKLEKVIREKDKKSEVSAIVDTARNELKVPDILTIIKNQQIAPYQGKLLEGVIKKISKLDIDNVLEVISQTDPADLDVALSVLAVIEPMDYNMANGGVFYEDFGFVFWSTSEMLRNRVELGTTSFLNNISTKLLDSVNLDRIIDDLKSLVEAKRCDYNYLFEIIQQFLNITLFTTQDGRHIHGIPFTTEFRSVILYWFYIGSELLEVNDIIKKHNEKRDLWLEKKIPEAKNSYLIVASEI